MSKCTQCGGSGGCACFGADPLAEAEAHGEHEAFPDLDAPDLSNGWEAFDKPLSAEHAGALELPAVQARQYPIPKATDELRALMDAVLGPGERVVCEHEFRVAELEIQLHDLKHDYATARLTILMWELGLLERE